MGELFRDLEDPQRMSDGQLVHLKSLEVEHAFHWLPSHAFY